MSDQTNPKTVLCFGDSQTWGFDPRGGADAIRYPFVERWTRRLGAKLGPGFHVVEEGLNGRTTVFDDPVMGGMSGLNDLLNILKSHMPVDLMIIMLGSNDVKTRLGVSGDEIARCLGRLLDVAIKSACGPDMQSPEILVLVPPPLGTLEGKWLELLFDAQNGHAKTERLRVSYPEIAALYGVHCYDTAKVLKPGEIDGVHIDPDGLEPLADALSHVVEQIFANNK
ncbi:MAG: GDSL-type esterase/lipase family protein [Stappiaceae bacterium]